MHTRKLVTRAHLDISMPCLVSIEVTQERDGRRVADGARVKGTCTDYRAEQEECCRYPRTNTHISSIRGKSSVKYAPTRSQIERNLRCDRDRDRDFDVLLEGMTNPF